MESFNSFSNGKGLDILVAMLMIVGKLKVDSVVLSRSSRNVNVTLVGKFKNIRDRKINRFVEFLNSNGKMNLNEVFDALQSRVSKKKVTIHSIPRLNRNYTTLDLLKGKNIELIAMTLLVTGKLFVDEVEVFRNSPAIVVTLVGKYRDIHKNKVNPMVDFLDEYGDMTIDEVVAAFKKM